MWYFCHVRPPQSPVMFLLTLCNHMECIGYEIARSTSKMTDVGSGGGIGGSTSVRAPGNRPVSTSARPLYLSAKWCSSVLTTFPCPIVPYFRRQSACVHFFRSSAWGTSEAKVSVRKPTQSVPAKWSSMAGGGRMVLLGVDQLVVGSCTGGQITGGERSSLVDT